MSRVLLFVQTGDGRPKCVGTANSDTSNRHVVIRPGLLITTHASLVRKQADRWWLVECENAEAGRRVICTHSYYGATCRDCGANMTVNYGRILASGGKA